MEQHPTVFLVLMQAELREGRDDLVMRAYDRPRSRWTPFVTLRHRRRRRRLPEPQSAMLPVVTVEDSGPVDDQALEFEHALGTRVG